MSENSGIQWTTHTFNPWWGCAKVSPGCDNCYAERDSKRYGFDLWGVGANRRTFGDKHWNEPLKWDRASAVSGQRARVFCASMADVFDKDAPHGARERLWGLIRSTPNLDWQLLTKRIGNVPKMLPDDWGHGYRNVWLGISVVNQEEVDRDIPKLLAVHAAVRFLSCEPLLDAIDLKPFLWQLSSASCRHETRQHLGLPALGWVIVGGESGHKAREFHVEWAQSVTAQCGEAGIPCFVKQVGAKPLMTVTFMTPGGWAKAHTAPLAISDRKGGVPEDWPESMRVREFPA